VAGPTRLELATSGVTGRHSNRLNYDPAEGTALSRRPLWACQRRRHGPRGGLAPARLEVWLARAKPVQSVLVTERGVVAAGSRATARAGAWALREGGNAVDAVCAAAFASFVAEPPLTSPAGAGVLLHGDPERGWSVHDFFARVPGLGGRPDELEFFLVTIDFGVTTQDFHVGRGAAAVPGALRGLLDVHRAHGRLPLAEVVAPAHELAQDGCVVSAAVAGVLRLLDPIMHLTPEVRDLVFVDGVLAREGSRLRAPGQAHLLEGLARDPKETVRAVEADLLAAFGPAHGGLLSAADLEAYRPLARVPLAVPFAGYTVLTNPPPSAGGGLIGLGLRLAERTGLLDQDFGQHDVALARVLGGVSFARAQGYDGRLCEPGFLDTLLSDDGVDVAAAAWAAAAAERGLGGTTHISVLDAEGGAASLTTSNGEGCGYALPAWGIHVNNFLGEDDINPHGFHVDPAGTEMITMMAPTIVLEDGRPRLVLGSGGSNRLRSAVLIGLLQHLGFGRDLEASVTADRMHVEGNKLWFEATHLDADVIAELRHAWPDASLFDHRSMFFGGIHAAANVGGHFVGAGDPRRDGAVFTPDDV
jgi:gamma-glutamyltranspeptidase/glutathione hydrolase